MMNFDIKRKINTLRDILVGKVPDPKAQVEQITIALIYKFMDDMDLQGVEFGGSRVFFTGEYEKYAFSQIMLAEHSAQDKLNLYAEGMDKMVDNPDLPKLFRDILRNTYIPYRDPDTLNRFLKEIAEFSYDDSEDLGNAFEYLLSIMGSQGDAGQFRTPRHIIDMMVEIVAPQKNETILDPACGTAGFLISAYNYIKKNNVDENGNSTLTPDDRNRMTESFEGYDISPDMVRLSRVNMYLHGFTTPKINEYDTLTSLDRWDDNFDVILANPPFMTPKGGINPHKRYRVDAKRAEVLFVDYIAEHLNPTGRAAIIVPEGIIFQSQTAYKNLRKMLVDEGYLYGVISLPSGVFNPYSGVKTSILLIDRTLAKQKDSILFVKLNNDGYDLGAQRREIKGSEIPDVINTVMAYRNGKDISGYANVVIAAKSIISKQEYILVGERYVDSAPKDNCKWPLVQIGDCCKLLIGGTPSKQEESFWKNGSIKWISSKYIDDVGRITSYDLITDEAVSASATKIAPKGSTILVTRVSVGKTAFADDCYAINQDMTCLIPDERLDPVYLYVISKKLAESIERDAQGIGVRGVTQKYVASLEIPLPPLAIQREIIEEIAGCQKIIDGARQVVKNYKPTVKISNHVVFAKMGEICEIVRGSSPRPAGDPRYYGGTVPRLMVADITRDGMFVTPKIDFLTEEGAQHSRPMRSGDLVMAVSGQPGICAILKTDACIHDGFVGFKNISADYSAEFLCVYLNSIKEFSSNLSVGAVFKNLKTDQIREFKIPILPLSEQLEIVAAIREEMSIIDQNKRLIEIFQQKISDKIAEIWGE